MKCHFCISIHFVCSKVIGATMAGTTMAVPVFISYHIFVLLLTGLNKRSKFNYIVMAWPPSRLHDCPDCSGTSHWQLANSETHIACSYKSWHSFTDVFSGLPGLWDIPLNIHNLPPHQIVHLANYWMPVTRVINVQDCHQRLSSAFDILLIFLCSLIPTTP